MSINSLLTVEEVARYLRITKQTLWRWVKEGKLPKPIYLAPRNPRFDMEELARFLKGDRTPSEERR